jgi:hypothetical protein
MKSPFLSPLLRWLEKLSSPRLFLLVGLLLFLDLLIPDVIPLVDEVILGLATLLLARWKKDKPELEHPTPPKLP